MFWLHLGLRFLSDANISGAEKVTVALPPQGMMTKRPSLTASDLQSSSADLISPLGLLMVKGWTRSVAAMSVMLACFENTDFYEAQTVFELNRLFIGFIVEGFAAECEAVPVSESRRNP